MTGHDYLLKWITETYPLMDSSDYGELDYYDMQKFAVWLVKLLTIPHVIKSVCENCSNTDFNETMGCRNYLQGFKCENFKQTVL